LVVEASGDVLPCSAFSGVQVDDPVGNILQHSLKDVWQQSVYLQTVRRALRDQDGCAGCLAQKAVASGRIAARLIDPLQQLLPDYRAAEELETQVADWEVSA
jgi:radical SAM protein with 4Fe4S-binding SPASM domain